MPRVAKLPGKSIWTHEFGDIWLLVGLGVITLLATATLAVRTLFLVTDLDSEVGQIYEMKRDIRRLKEDVRANQIINDNWHMELNKSMNDLNSLASSSGAIPAPRGTPPRFAPHPTAPSWFRQVPSTTGSCGRTIRPASTASSELLGSRPWRR